MLSTGRLTTWLRLALALAVAAWLLCIGVTSAYAATRPLGNTSAIEVTTVVVTNGGRATHLVPPTLSATPRSTRHREVGRRAPRPPTSQLTGVIRTPDASPPPACGYGDLAPDPDRMAQSGRTRWHGGVPTRAPPQRR
jgi:hypothetical protein